MTDANSEMTAPEATPVLIVGGSLVGLSAAVFLAWQGVPVLVVDKHRSSSSHPRAIGFTTRTMEHFRQVGVELPASLQGMKPPRRARVESLAGDWFEEYPWSPGTKGAYGAEASPVRATAITQDRLEPILRERALQLGAELRLGTEMLDLTQDDNGVSATLRCRDDGREYEVRAQYVIAADGADSPIRKACDINRHGQGHLSVQRSILFRAPLDEYLEHGVVQFEIDQPDFQAFLTTYSDGRWVLMLSDDLERTTDEQIRTVHRAIGRDDLPIEVITTGRWELAALIADRFSIDRVFLAGDAAHQLPPNRGGFGANTGIDDAHNLAWKLAAVLSGTSSPALLDSYDSERRPIADLRHDQLFARVDYKAHLKTASSSVPILDDTAIELGQLYRSAAIMVSNTVAESRTVAELPAARVPAEWAGQPGTRAPHLWCRWAGREISVLDLFGRNWVLLSDDDRWAEAATNASGRAGVPVTFVHIGSDAKPEVQADFHSAFGIGSGGATLIRPDGYIAWRVDASSNDRLKELTAALDATAAPTGAPTLH